MDWADFNHLTFCFHSMRLQHIIRVVIDLDTSRTDARCMASLPLLPPAPTVVFRIRIVDVGRKFFRRTFERWNVGRAWVPIVDISLALAQWNEFTHNGASCDALARWSLHLTAFGS